MACEEAAAAASRFASELSFEPGGLGLGGERAHRLGGVRRKLGREGSNVNQLTSQALTDLGRGPTFYDCLVEVKAG